MQVIFKTYLETHIDRLNYRSIKNNKFHMNVVHFHRKINDYFRDGIIFKQWHNKSMSALMEHNFV